MDKENIAMHLESVSLKVRKDPSQLNLHRYEFRNTTTRVFHKFSTAVTRPRIIINKPFPLFSVPS